MREALTRLRLAWRALRYGADGPPCPVPVALSAVTVREAIECCLAFAGLRHDWAQRATLQELEVLAGALAAAREVRKGEWAAIEAGRWPR